MDCIFCKIINKEIPAGIVYENDCCLAIKDIEPKATVHIMIIPKKHVISVDYLKPEDKDLVGEMVFTAKKIAKTQGVAETGYRLIFNIGKDAGQTVDHLHLHLMGGAKLSWA